jgi:integrase
MILDFTELRDSLQNAIDDCPIWYSDLKDFMYTLFWTGCRPDEVLKLNLWSDYGEEVLRLEALKDNNPRIIPKEAVAEVFLDSILNNYPYFQSYNYNKFNQSFARVYQYPNAYVLDKRCGLYLFRHYYIKKLWYDGLTIPEIMQITGHKSPPIVEGYINSIIYTI